MSHQYELLEGSNRVVLSNLVNERLADGWELWGAPFGLVNPEKEFAYSFCQAVVKFDSDQEALSATITNETVAGYSGINSAMVLGARPIIPLFAPAGGDFLHAIDEILRTPKV
jgi:hypothetical protein